MPKTKRDRQRASPSWLFLYFGCCDRCICGCIASPICLFVCAVACILAGFLTLPLWLLLLSEVFSYFGSNISWSTAVVKTPVNFREFFNRRTHLSFCKTSVENLWKFPVNRKHSGSISPRRKKTPVLWTNKEATVVDSAYTVWFCFSYLTCNPEVRRLYLKSY